MELEVFLAERRKFDIVDFALIGREAAQLKFSFLGDDEGNPAPVDAVLRLFDQTENLQLAGDRGDERSAHVQVIGDGLHVDIAVQGEMTNRG
jgi:hypothetical protein